MPPEEQPKLEIISGGASLAKPPDPDELEISIFGPGYGECIVLHLGDNVWFVVDSCIDIYTRKPAALTYFDKLGIDPSVAVKQIIATHWHDDHIRGFADIVKACPCAELVVSQAMCQDEFGALINCFGTRVMVANSGAYEFHRVLMLMMERKQNGSGNHVPKWAIKDRPIWRGKVGCFGNVDCELISLSPSDSAVLASKLEFAKLLPKAGSYKGWVRSITPNHSSVAIRLKAGEFSVLLGADLEETNDPTSGWSAIVSSHSPRDGTAAIYKIAHHGSITGHHHDVWRKMLIGQPLAVLTPFRNGGKSLPTDGDVRRIVSLTPYSYSTARRDKKVGIRRDKTVEKMITAATKSIRVLDASSGQVRIRLKASDLATVQLFGDAHRLDLPHATSGTALKRKTARGKV